MRRRDQIGSKYNLPSSLNVGGYFTIKINRLRVNAYAKIAVNENARFSTFSNFFENVPTSQNRSNFAWGGFSGSSFTWNQKKWGKNFSGNFLFSGPRNLKLRIFLQRALVHSIACFSFTMESVQ